MSNIFVFDDFDQNIDNSQWLQINNGIANTNFGSLFNNGASINSKSLFFTGNGTRSALTNGFNVFQGGTITFDLILGNSQNGGEQVDAGEDVVLQYSTDNGSTWFDITTYSPGAFDNWTRITQIIPLAAQTTNTQFRWIQPTNSGSNFDQWALDNVEIQAPVHSIGDDFDPGINSLRWSEISNGLANNNFGGSGNSLFFDGGPAGFGTRFATTNLVNAPSGGMITFDLIFGDGTNGGENADAGEDVVLQYSLDRGITWFDIATYDQDAFTSWTRISENIPLEAQFQAATLGVESFAFRFMQLNHSGNTFDHWALDNVEIQTAPALSSIIDDFDPYVDSLQWSNVSNGAANSNFNQLANINYGGTLNSNSLFFTGVGNRSAATNLVDTADGGNIIFDLIIGDGTNGGENADAGEDVVLQYSTDGITWLDIATYNQDTFTSWTRISENIPLEAVRNGNAAFRFIQPNHNDGSFDEWAIDNVAIQETLVESNDTILEAIDSGLSSANPGIFSTTSAIGNNPNIAPESDVDLIGFQLDAGDTVTIDIDADEFGSSLNPLLLLFNSAGNPITFSDNNPNVAEGELFTLDPYLSFTAGVTDTYYIGVSSFNNLFYDPFVEGSGIGLSTGEYEITIEVV